MARTITIVACGCWLLSAGSAPADDTAPVPYRVADLLCDTADHAIQFADALAAGEGDEIAKDRVGRAAGAEVCGRYAGVATVESESVVLRSGVAYGLIAYRFREDRRLAWRADTSFAPKPSGWNL